MPSDTSTYVRELSVLYRAIGIICQSFVFGFYACLFPLSTYVMLKKGLRTRLRKFLFGMTVFMFILSTFLWAVTIVDLIRSIKVWLLDSRPGEDFPQYFTLFNAFGLVNYVLTDGVVVWRAWVLCHDENRKALFVPMFLLCCTGATTFATIGIRITLSAAHHLRADDIKHLGRAIDVCQVTNLSLSLLTNIASTLIISRKAWRYRRAFKSELNSTIERRTKAGKIMLLLVETGLLYCISCTTVLIGTVIRLPAGTVGDIYTPVNIQMAGLYPIIVLLLVNQEQSFEKTVFVSTIPSIHHGAVGSEQPVEPYPQLDQHSQLESMSFVSRSHGTTVAIERSPLERIASRRTISLHLRSFTDNGDRREDDRHEVREGKHDTE
ncbi:hypothetical protein K435DRAFT_768381 [Dendrothele bispora CBS 962.96]|uniref:Uncharacterized protein n=1 Tax=Dendrothele bispora (strain CBS 962.96) TaxID=1314807 RepID=A0A4S8KVR4_DENBC|nr:hypothetical protein K435DRAFT_768381 [Dendrothele bispora CBS 962.96]